jgi:hypothetical protein
MMKDIVERHRKVVVFLLAKNIIKLFCIKSRQGSKVGWGAKTLYLTKGSDKDKTKKKSEVFLVL